MPDTIPTPEQQSLFQATTDLVAAFQTLVDDNAKMKDADDAYDAVAVEREQRLADFQAANAAFSASPSDPNLLQEFLAAIQLLGQTSQDQSVKKVAKDDADNTDGVALASYTAVKADVQTKFEAFIAANTVG